MNLTSTESWAAHSLRCELAAEVLHSSGHVRIQVTGWSMLPTLWPGDTLLIERAVSDEVSPGDIVLCARNRRFFVHRVVGKDESTIMTCGDAMPQPDPPVAHRGLLGKVRFVLRRGGRIEPARTLRFPKRAVAALIQRSHLAARIFMALHTRRQGWKLQNLPDQAVAVKS